MPIKVLEVNNVRNLKYAKLDCSSGSNLIIGPNGSGKTSLLESISLLSQGKSFRNSLKKSVISDTQTNLTVTAKLEDDQGLSSGTRVGISKFSNGKTLIKVSGEKINRISQITSLVPVCVIEPNSTEIVEGSPSFRRSVIDWGVFHVEHSFVNHWRTFSNALKQRNALLKTKPFDVSLLSYWDKMLTPPAEAITRQRREYIENISAELDRSVRYFFGAIDLTVSLVNGWDTKLGFEEQLNISLGRDKKYGSTSEGPHKADLLIQVDGHLAKDYLSRGQKKLAVYALRLAQIEYYQRISGKKVSLLLDDLPSELDRNNCQKVCEQINRLGCQVFITSVDTSNLNEMIMDALSPTVFHVKHGTLDA